MINGPLCLEFCPSVHPTAKKTSLHSHMLSALDSRILYCYLGCSCRVQGKWRGQLKQQSAEGCNLGSKQMFEVKK